MNSLIEFVTSKYTCRYEDHNRCAHVFRWGTKKGIKCGRISKYNDKLCYKHRYRYVASIELIYKYIKNLFGEDMKNDINIISDKYVIENISYNSKINIYKNNEEMLNIYDNYEYFFYRNSDESCHEYIDKLSSLCELLKEYYNEYNIYKIYTNVIFDFQKEEKGTELICCFFNSLIQLHFLQFSNEFKKIYNYNFQHPISENAIIHEHI